MVGAVVLALFVDHASVVRLMEALHNAQFRAASWRPLALHLGLSVCLWLLVYLVGSYLSDVYREKRPPHLVRLVSATRASVMTETVIALPVILMLVFGIAQLSINNMAGIFTNLATFEAARSAWLWEREPCDSIECDAAERARIQAAAVLTPVVPGGLRIENASLTQAAQEMRGILVGAQLPQLTDDMGHRGIETANHVMMGTRREDGSLIEGLDISSFATRTVRKFTFAYLATHVTISYPTPSTMRVKLVYRHHNAMPFVGHIFGVAGEVGGRRGYYTDIKRIFEIKRLPRPNRHPLIGSHSPRLY